MQGCLGYAELVDAVEVVGPAGIVVGPVAGLVVEPVVVELVVVELVVSLMIC